MRMTEQGLMLLMVVHMQMVVLLLVLMLLGTEGAAIPVDELIPEEQHITYDREHSKVERGSKFPSLKELRLAIRQCAINEEFDIGTTTSDPTRLMGYCRAKGCPWKILARRMVDNKTIRVHKIEGDHACYSSSRIKSTRAY